MGRRTKRRASSLILKSLNSKYMNDGENDGSSDQVVKVDSIPETDWMPGDNTPAWNSSLEHPMTSPNPDAPAPNNTSADTGNADNNTNTKIQPNSIIPTSPQIPQSEVSLPESYIADARRRAGISEVGDLPSQTLDPTNILNAMHAAATTPSPADDAGTPPTMPQNISYADDIASRNAGLNPNSSRYHTSRKRQALVAALSSLAMFADPSMPDTGALGLLAPAAAAAIAASGKNTLGQKNLREDTARSQAQQEAETQRKLRDAQLQEIQSRPTQRDLDRQSKERIAAQSASTREQIASASNAVKEAIAEKKRIQSDSQVSRVVTMVDEDGHVVHRVYRRDGNAEDIPIMQDDGNGNKIPMTSGQWKLGRGRLDVASRQADIAQQNANSTSTSVGIRADEASGGTESTTSTSTQFRRTRDEIAGEVYGDNYNKLNIRKQRHVDQLFNAPDNKTESRTTRKSRSGTSNTPRASRPNPANRPTSDRATELLKRGYKIRVKVKSGDSVLVTSVEELENLKKQGQIN